MDEKLLRVAQDGLHIIDIALRASRASLADKFEPKYEHPAIEPQFMLRTARSEVMEISNGDAKRELFRVFVDLGVRWVRAPKRGKGKPAKRTAAADEKPDVLAMIEATFIVEYEMPETIEQAALDEFALHNVPWHVWPFWREFVASQCMRLNLPKVAMPMQCLAPQPNGQETPKGRKKRS
ncbi:MAG: hypothetical protein L0H70_03155 [Xanthomonadales bacterium]|nr:hypothetical protein [Xanthomonadales bacterium]